MPFQVHGEIRICPGAADSGSAGAPRAEAVGSKEEGEPSGGVVPKFRSFDSRTNQRRVKKRKRKNLSNLTLRGRCVVCTTN